MFILALIIGLYANIITLLGFAGFLRKDIIFFVTVLFVISVVVITKKIKLYPKKLFFLDLLNDKLSLLFFTMICLSTLVNLLGALGPETAFDSLWYHLTLPKLFLSHGEIYFIPGGLFYYSALPKLTEMLYIPALLFEGEISAKLIHFGFGLLTLFSLYFLARRYFNVFFSLIAVGIFISNLVFAFETTVSFNDLTWTFYELLAFYAFVIFLKTQRIHWVMVTGVMLGFAVMTKPVAVVSIVIYFLLLLYFRKENRVFIPSLIILFFTLFIPLPWFLFSYLETGNPIYPFLSGILSSYESTVTILNLLDIPRMIRDILGLLLFSPDPLSPLYILFLPTGLFVWKKLKKEEKMLFIYTVLSLCIWYVTPRSGGSRFILPYLPVFSLATALVLKQLKTLSFGKLFFSYSLVIVVIVMYITVGYRALANARYIPYLIGIQTKDEYLTRYLNFEFGDFYDTDRYFAESIKKTDKVLLIGFHNLYYVEFPYIHESYYKGEPITYIAVQSGNLPVEYKGWNLVYTNEKTKVKLYKRQR